MAYDQALAERLKQIFTDYPDVVEKKMFGGLAFLLSGNMCCGVVNDMLVVRVGPEHYEGALSKPHTREMDFTGKPLTGFIYVEPRALQSDDELKDWVAMCERFVRSLPPK